MKYIYDYKDNQVPRRSFDNLCRRTFGISFERWYEKGLWGDSYVCHSIQDGDRIVSNVSVTSMQLAGDHGLRGLTQIGTVMTDPEYRGKGLAAELMNRVIGQYENESEAFYLFANDTVLGFYPRFGFCRMERMEIFTRKRFNTSRDHRFRKLDMDNDAHTSLLTRVVEQRRPTSSRFFFMNNRDILYWYCLEIFPDRLFYDEVSDLIAIYSHDENTLNIYDLISPEPINYPEIVATLQTDATGETVFHFNLECDELELQQRMFRSDEEDDPMFVRGSLDMASFTYPVTAHT